MRQSRITVLLIMLVFLASSCGKGKDQPTSTTTNSAPTVTATTSLPAMAELKSVDDLISQNKYDEAFMRLTQIEKQYGQSAESRQRGIKAIILQVKWADTLTGDQRTQAMDKIVKRDFAGLICAASEEYMTSYGAADKSYVTVKAINDIARQSIENQPCRPQPMDKFDASAYVVRLKAAANLVRALKNFTFPPTPDPAP